MSPTEFDFKVSVRGDGRLLGAITHLTTHAAGYAQLPAHAGEQLARHVAQATEALLAASKAQGTFIEFRFYGDAEALVVTFSCEVAPTAPRPVPESTPNVTVEWTTEGSRRLCRIRHRLSV